MKVGSYTVVLTCPDCGCRLHHKQDQVLQERAGAVTAWCDPCQTRWHLVVQLYPERVLPVPRERDPFQRARDRAARAADLEGLPHSVPMG